MSYPLLYRQGRMHASHSRMIKKSNNSNTKMTTICRVVCVLLPPSPLTFAHSGPVINDKGSDIFIIRHIVILLLLIICSCFERQRIVFYEESDSRLMFVVQNAVKCRVLVKHERLVTMTL